MSRVMAHERISQILPTVKCSDCGQDVQIRKLGEHICSSAPAVPPLPILPQRQEPPAMTPRTTPGYTANPVHNPYGSRSDSKPLGGYGRTSPVTPPYGNHRDNRRPSFNDDSDDGDSPRRQPSPLTSRPKYSEDSFRSDGSSSYGGGSSYGNYGAPSSSGGGSSHAYPRHNDRPKTPVTLNTPTYDRPRKNSTSPAPPDKWADPDMSPPPRTGSPWQKQTSPVRATSPDYFGNAREPKKPSGSGALDSLMADLMSSFGSDINDVNQRPDRLAGLDTLDNCAVCGEEFDYRDDVVSSRDRTHNYHKACYTCHLCRAPFDSRRPPLELNGKLYCERDYNVTKKRMVEPERQRPNVPHGNPPMGSGTARYKQPPPRQCYHCNLPLDERTGYKEHQGRVYCRADFKKLFLPICRACEKPVEREAVSAMDGKLQGKWHPDCFGCHTCHRPFPDNTFYVFENAPYCRRHYHQLNNSLCRTCDDPIEGPCAQTIEGWRFHPACFRCDVCRCAITDVYYMFERRIYCETHIRQLQRQRNIRAEKRKTQFGQV